LVVVHCSEYFFSQGFACKFSSWYAKATACMAVVFYFTLNTICVGLTNLSAIKRQVTEMRK
jgi:hypothetical protein